MIRIESDFHDHAAAIHIRYEGLSGFLTAEQLCTHADAVFLRVYRIFNC